MSWQEEDYLQLSGLQHFAFCRRQWALIHIEAQWAENYRTVDGTLINTRMVKPGDFQHMKSGAVFMTEDGRKALLKSWQEKKKETLTHPYLSEKLSWRMIPCAQALLLARYLRGDLDAYPPFLWK